MKAVIMAGGEGARLRPLTQSRPKPLAPMVNQSLMARLVAQLRDAGFTEMLATVHYLAPEIQAQFGDGSEFGVSMEYLVEESPLGSAGSVKAASDWLGSDPFLIVSGDSLTDCDFQRLVEFHKASGGLATLALARNSKPTEFGVVVLDDRRRIVRFIEKPSWPEVISDTVNTGIYVVDPAALDFMRPGERYDWSGDVFPAMLSNDKPLFGFEIDGYWADVGSLAQYREAHERLLSREIQLPISGEQMLPGVFVDGPAQIDPTAQLTPPLALGRNCKIKAGARVGPYTSIGDNALIEERAIVERSILWDSVYIGANVGVHGAIVGSRAALKRDVQVQEGSVIGDRCVLDVGVAVRPGVKIWPDKFIERGSVVTMSLIWGSKWSSNLFRDKGVAGLSNLEITPELATRLGAAFGSVFQPGSTIIACRDSARSSRMIKRALTAAALGVGCNIVDLRCVPLPVARRLVGGYGGVGGVAIRKLPYSSRVTLIEFFDRSGSALPREQERQIESIFFREDFHRIDPDDLGSIEYSSRTIELYQTELLQMIRRPEGGTPLTVVCDFGWSAVGSVLGPALASLGVEMVALNAHPDAKKTPRTEVEIRERLDVLGEHVRRLGYDLGALFLEDGDRVALVDSDGEIISGSQALWLMSLAFAELQDARKIAVGASLSPRIVSALESQGIEIVRGPMNDASLLRDAKTRGVAFFGNELGKFAFPNFHWGFDALFTFAQLVVWLQTKTKPVRDLCKDCPESFVVRSSAPILQNAKAEAMRRLNEIEATTPGEWRYASADPIEPMIHLFAEGASIARSQEIVDAAIAELAQLA